MTKEFERMLKILHSEYEFSPVVQQHHRDWWYGVAHRYLIGYSRFIDEMIHL